MLFPSPISASNLLETQKIKTDFFPSMQGKINNKNFFVNDLKSTLCCAIEHNSSKIEPWKCKKKINNYFYMIFQWKILHYNIHNQNIFLDLNIYNKKLNKRLIFINNKIINLLKINQQKKITTHYINELTTLISQKIIKFRNILNFLKIQKILLFHKNNLLVKKNKFISLCEYQKIRLSKTSKLEFADRKINIIHKYTVSELNSALSEKKYNSTFNILKIFKKYSNFLHEKQFKYLSIQDNTIILNIKNDLLPKSIKQQVYITHELLMILEQQTRNINKIALKQQEVSLHTLQVKQALTNLTNQAQWLNKSPVLGATLRSQFSKLPKMPKLQKIDHDMKKLRSQRLIYENKLKKLTFLPLKNKQDDNTSLTLSQQHIITSQITKQRNIIIMLLNSFDTQILALTKLKISSEELQNILKDMYKAIHRYLFWIPDIPPITISYPLDVYQDCYKLLTMYKLKNLVKILYEILFVKKKILILTILCISIYIIIYYIAYYFYQKFLEQSSKKIGKINQDNFLVTFHNIWSSILISLPFPIAWEIIGYNLSNSWSCITYEVIGDSMRSTTILLWILLIGARFASTHGLFITHFGWSQKKVQIIFSKNYIYNVSIIIFLTTTTMIFNHYNNQEFHNTLGRLCFISLCIYLIFITNKLKIFGLNLHTNKYKSSDNIINHFLWNIMLCAPIISVFTVSIGYFFATQALLARLEISLLIWVIILIIYHIIRRWMHIQSMYFTLKSSKTQCTILSSKEKKNNNLRNSIEKINTLTLHNKENKNNLDLDTISAQSLQLIRSILTLIALLLMTLLWSELRSAFSFLENITLWDVTSTIKGIDNIQPITLNAFLIAILVIIITTQTARNLPAFLELTFLQRLNISSGTRYTITTLTKYILMLLGGIIGCSLIGIEWVKIQWLIAALGVGLGFGLQEIFANFISGVMILFEKPIRIGDTVTIDNFTGNITKISIRATIITDWDHREIIVPNREFITKKFINWSLSDKIIRVVLRFPVPPQTNINTVIKTILKMIKTVPYILENPSPEIYLANIQQGFPILEARTYVSDIKYRMLIRHQIHMLIFNYYKDKGLNMPYIPTYLYYLQLYMHKDF
ncbi:miniconductance mechanosensitive channel MscM [Candidatus Blochmannia ocreatus]|uniref:Miniconductance mechanosensitive channel MscM n=1 Tax=Candidatus Blochmannia ocreatus (nom. nud.) TaxID=251538 RepID=A0ABY4ST66_9ENTR|nr:miniconductance mechanosensitive channel MscM [Candidatus Blochmannia ocreatus]